MPFPRIVKPAGIRRDELLDCAQRLFARQGYDGTSVSDIIGAVGVSKGAFYHHFSSKEDLIEALACRYAQDAAEDARAILEDQSLDAFSRLVAFTGSIRRHKLTSAPEMRATFEPLFRAENVRLFERTTRAVTGVVAPILSRIIAEGVADRTFDTPDPDGAAEVILHLLSANRDITGQLFAAADRQQFDLVAARLRDKLAFAGTVIDRILGLPEGSLELVDGAALSALAETLGHADSAA